MPKEAKLTNYVGEYLINELEKIYNERFSNKIQKKELPVFPTKKSLIEFVFKSSRFVRSDNLDGHILEPNELVISPGTVRDAVNILINDNRIRKGSNGYEFVPHQERELENYPIFDIASKINVTVGMPENIMFLTVGHGLAESLAEYLSAQFFKGDIIFIPLGTTIMCVEVYPKDMIINKTQDSAHSPDVMRERIESVLSNFNLIYPAFQHDGMYEYAFTANHDPSQKAAAKEIAAYDVAHNISSMIQGETQGDALYRYQRTIEFSTKLGDLLSEYSDVEDIPFPESNSDEYDEEWDEDDETYIDWFDLPIDDE